MSEQKQPASGLTYDEMSIALGALGMDEPELINALHRQPIEASDKRISRTKEAVQKALLELMNEQDFDSITIAAVARRANIDRKTFYLHYSTIDDVLDEILYVRATKIVKTLQTESIFSQGQGDLTGFLIQLSADLISSIPVTKEIIKHTSTERLLNKVEEVLTQTLLEQAEASGVEAGPYLVYYVTFTCAGVMAVYRRWLLSDSEVPLENLAQATSVIAYTGINGALNEQV